MLSLGLDIGYHSIKAVVLAGDGSILKAVKADFPGSDENDETKMCTFAIKKLFQDHNLPVDNIIINLHGSYILARTYMLPPGSKNDFEKWFVDNIESLIPGVPFSDVIYDHQFLNSGRVLISFARLGVVEARIKTLKECGLLPKAIDAACLALLYVFENHRWVTEKRTFAILDVGKDGSDLLIIKDGAPFVSSEIPATMAGEKGHQPFCEQLAARLSQIFGYYREKDGVNIDRMLLTGEYPRLNRLKKELEANLHMEIQHGRPFAAVKNKMPVGFKLKSSGQYAQAYGLAIKGLNNRKDINLMPHEKRSEHETWCFNRKAKKFFVRNSVFAGIALLACLAFSGIIARSNNKVSARITGLEAQKNVLLAVSAEEDEYQQKAITLQDLHRSRLSWTKMLQILGQAVPDGICLKEIQTETRLVTEQSGPVKMRRIIIEGEATDKKEILSFVRNLERQFNNIVIDKIAEDVKCEFKISLAL